MMSEVTTPQVRPARPYFSSGPCAKPPVWDASKIATESLGRSHRAKIGKTRVIALTSPRFTAAPFVVRQAPVIATMHANVALFFADALGLAVSPAPIELPDVTISMLWHSSYDADPSSYRWGVV